MTEQQKNDTLLGSDVTTPAQDSNVLSVPRMRNSHQRSHRVPSNQSSASGKDLISQVTAIAQPRIISGFSPTKR